MAAYQQPYAGGFVPPPPPGWGQPQYQPLAYGQPAPPQSALTPTGPPSKKQKGNPVITKYPPPPAGWKPPFQATGHQPPATGFEAHQYPAVTAGGYQSSQPAILQYQAPVPYSQPPYQADPSQVYHYEPAHAYEQPPYQPAQPYQPPQYYPPPAHPYQLAPQYSAAQPRHPQPSYQPPQASQPPQAHPIPHQYQQPTSHVAPQPHPNPQTGYYDANGAWEPSQPANMMQTAQTSVSAHATGSSIAGAPSEDGRDYIRQPSVEYGDLDLDFDGEAISMTDAIDPALSLGLIIWHPAGPRKRPLPATFKEAELEDLAQAKPPKDEDESISKYFVNSKKHEVELSIRQTDEWEQAKDDLIFVEFPETCEVVPFLTIIENRVRPDATLEQSESPYGEPMQVDPKSAPEQTSQSVPSTQAIVEAPCGDDAEDTDGDQAMDMSDEEDEDEPVKPAPKQQDQPVHVSGARQESKSYPANTQRLPHKLTNVLDSLEEALGPNEPFKSFKQPRPSVSARYSRSRSPEKMNRSRQGSQQPRSRPAPHPRDATQESVLAALGVEGSPKMVYPTPPPALGAPASPDRNRSRSPDKFRQPANGMVYPKSMLPYGPNFPPPPPPREVRSPSFDPWKAHDALHGNTRRSPSVTSQHTAVGSDFYPDDNHDADATPKAKSQPQAQHDRFGGPDSGRKRTYDRMTEPEVDKRRRQPDDTPRARRKPNYDRTDAYSRRW